MKMKRTAIIILILIFSMCALFACGGNPSVVGTGDGDLADETRDTESAAEDEKPMTDTDETDKDDSVKEESGDTDNTEETTVKLKITVNGKVFFAELNDSAASRELCEKLPITVDMTELNGNEKYYYLPDKLTRDDKKAGRIEVGDIMLYSGNCLVLFYDSFSTVYSYTPLGKITDTTGLKDALGKGNVTVSFELAK